MMKMKTAFGSIAIVLAATACAKRPENISAADIGATGYDAYSCQQLATEEVSLTADLENLSAKQRSVATTDAWTVFLFLLPIASMSGNDQEAEIAIVKAKQQEVARIRTEKQC